MGTSPTVAAFDFAAHPRKVNLGCGQDHKPGYLNVDFKQYHDPELLADVCELAGFPDACFEEVFACDVLEHLPRTATANVLAVWNRVLAPGGRVYIRAPSVPGLVDLINDPGYQTVERQQLLIQCLFGSQADTGDFHFTGFTDITMRHFVKQAGFRLDTIGMRDRWLFEVWGTKTGAPADPMARLYAGLCAIFEPTRFVTECYRQVLGREPDAGGLAHHLSNLDAGTYTRAGVLDIFVCSPEAVARRKESQPA
jgi:predicted SAM-dependent methyltransferase